jgi:radical SAM superfamily enzyme
MLKPDGCRWRSLNASLREQFGEKVYKLALDGGFTCPTRDGTLGTRGCSFCDGGSGDFSVPVGEDVFAAIEAAKQLVAIRFKIQEKPGEYNFNIMALGTNLE